MKKIVLIFILNVLFFNSKAQIISSEDSLHAGLDPGSRNVILSGYGEAKYSYNATEKTAEINLTRNVLFVGYRFSPKITLFTELEVEDAKVDPDGGELAMEQCLLKFDLNKNNYILGGLIIPRIGILNENHLPVTFNGNDRHFVERYIIPATWRELGIGYYGSTNKIPGLNWSLAVLNGLNGANISGEKGLREARYEGREASATNLAVTGSLLYFISGFRIQASGYYGGTVALAPDKAKQIGLEGGAFGTPVAMNDINVQYRKKGITVKLLAAMVTVKDAGKLNDVYNENAPEEMHGYMAELGYNLLETSRWKEKQLNLFVRYEDMDMMSKVPSNGIKDDSKKMQYLVAGLTYLPVPGVAIKLDWTHRATGTPNPVLLDDPATELADFNKTNEFIQFGLAYSF